MLVAIRPCARSTRAAWSLANARKASLTAVFGKSFDISDEDDFERRVLNAPAPLLVDFHAGWCGPCKALAPLLEEAVEQQGVELARVDVDVLADIALEWEVKEVPAVLAVKDGKVVGKFVGFQSKAFISEFLHQHNIIKN